MARDWLPPLPLAFPQTWPTTQTCALARNQTNNLSVYRPPLNPLSHTCSQGRGRLLLSNKHYSFSSTAKLLQGGRVNHSSFQHITPCLACTECWINVDREKERKKRKATISKGDFKYYSTSFYQHLLIHSFNKIY